MPLQTSLWPYLPTLARPRAWFGNVYRVERERRGKEAGLRTFAFAALLGCLGSLLGDAYALLAIALLGLLITFLNLHELRANQGTELTTSAHR
jgi:hypothetical protein